jgi:hypothetical protein
MENATMRLEISVPFLGSLGGNANLLRESGAKTIKRIVRPLSRPGAARTMAKGLWASKAAQLGSASCAPPAPTRMPPVAAA